MISSIVTALPAFLAFASTVATHGYVKGIVIGDEFYSGYVVTQFPYERGPPAVIGWTTTATNLGYVGGAEYADPDIICHQSATPGQLSAPVAAGATIELQWSPWPDSHHGPVITYLANCNGNCSSVDKSKLEFVKIDQVGLINYTALPGTWGADGLIAANNSWTVTIPSSIEPGNYVLRHEIIALHEAKLEDGAQNYPQCINLEITGKGTASPSGTPGESLYSPSDPGLLINIYTSLSTYAIPGPTLWAGAASDTVAPTTATVTSSAATISSAVADAPTTLIASTKVVTTVTSPCLL